MIISTESLSKITNFDDRGTAILFGDGAGATLLSKGDGCGRFLGAYLRSHGHRADSIYCGGIPNGHPFLDPNTAAQQPKRFPDAIPKIIMDGQEVFRFAVSALPEAVQGVLDQAGLTTKDIRCVVPHQANQRILNSAARRLKLPNEKMISYIDDLGNVSSATIPICLDRLLREPGRLTAGDRVVICGFGGGLTYGAALFELGERAIKGSSA